MSEQVAAGVLTTDVPAVDAVQAQLILQQQYGLRGEVTPLQGERDRNFCLTSDNGRQYMARFINAAEAPLEIDFQTTMLRHIEQRNAQLPIPRVISNRDGNDQPQILIHDQPHTLRLVSYLAGTPQYLRPSSEPLMRSLGDTLGALYQALEDFTHPGAKRELLWDISDIQRLRPMLDAIDAAETRQRVERVLEAHASRVAPQLASLPTRVIHNDLNPHNVLADRSGDQVSGIIDFGDALYAPRINDLATALAYQLQDDADVLRLVRPLMHACQQRYPLSDAELALLPDLIASRLVLTITIAAWRARRYPHNRDYILRNVPHAVRSLVRLQTLPDFGDVYA
ncbi:phosphotransferase [Erwinia sp. V71]|uniref:phosphotransferase n=1 Tax=Erwinia sp. V71 TaxID=3369424 RepID=UPI003F6417B0